jgi:hypothetical protein
MAEDIVIETKISVLPIDLRVIFGQRLDQSQAGIGDDQPDTFQTPLNEVGEGTTLARFIHTSYHVDALISPNQHHVSSKPLRMTLR